MWLKFVQTHVKMLYMEPACGYDREGTAGHYSNVSTHCRADYQSGTGKSHETVTIRNSCETGFKRGYNLGLTSTPYGFYPSESG